MLSDKSTIDKTIGGNLHHAGCRLLILTNYLSTIQKMYQYISSISRADALDVVCCFNLDTLTITIDGQRTSVYKADYTAEGKVNTITNTTEVTDVVNTKLGTLPSTGGMGTYLFTIIGVVVMAGAAGAFFMSRRKGSEE